ncbi:hypothetical protein [Algoriphagus sp.]|uniref:hypothetical protein n=1 Tax=Algoriphagus sp. TaxID=1872435 RepID=UPI003919A5C9
MKIPFLDLSRMEKDLKERLKNRFSEVLEADHNAHLFVIQTEKRDELKTFLAAKGIGTAIH